MTDYLIQRKPGFQTSSNDAKLSQIGLLSMKLIRLRWRKSNRRIYSGLFAGRVIDLRQEHSTKGVQQEEGSFQEQENPSNSNIVVKSCLKIWKLRSNSKKMVARSVVRFGGHSWRTAERLAAFKVVKGSNVRKTCYPSQTDNGAPGRTPSSAAEGGQFSKVGGCAEVHLENKYWRSSHVIYKSLISNIEDEMYREKDEPKRDRSRRDQKPGRVRATRQYQPYQGQCYSPFHSPHILRQDIRGSVQPSSCQKVLFEDSEEDAEEYDRKKKNWHSSSKKGSPNRRREVEAAAPLIPSFSSQPEVAEKPAHPLQENSWGQDDIFGFNNRRVVRYHQTPRFKELLKSPMRSFLRTYHWKINNFRSQVIPRAPVDNIPIESNPADLIWEGYRVFLGLADHFKKEHAHIEARAMYKLAIYVQPCDDLCWELAIRHEEDNGDYEKAYTYAKVAYIFNRGDLMAEKVIKLSDKAQRPIEEVRGIMNFDDNPIITNFRTVYELARLEWCNKNRKNAFKLIYYLIKFYEGNLLFLIDFAKMCESRNYVLLAADVIGDYLFDNNIKYPQLYTMFFKLAEQIYTPNRIFKALETLMVKINSLLAGENKFKILLDIAQIYIRLGNMNAAKPILKDIIENSSTVLIKFKTFVFTCRALGYDPPMFRNSISIVEANRDRFIREQPPILYQFAEWKYYLYYNLFYLIDRRQQAGDLLRGAFERWHYSGRLGAEVLFMYRVSGHPQHMLARWDRMVRDNPKSGEIWCEGGRIFAELREYKKAKWCFATAMQLTPQYGDTFIEAYKLQLITGTRASAKALKYRVMYCQPFYGNVWCYLKADTPKASVSDIWRRVKYQVRRTIYKFNTAFEHGGPIIPQLTAIDSYNILFKFPKKMTCEQREYLYFAYDQFEPHKL